jgi:hypothetical protein
MQVQIENSEITEEYKQQLSAVQHELLIAKLVIGKLNGRIDEYERAEADRTRSAAAARAVAGTETGAQATGLPEGQTST